MREKKMESNFSFLETDFPVLYKYGCYAEQYLYNDPNSCLFKMGQMGEAIINLMFDFKMCFVRCPEDLKDYDSVMDFEKIILL